MTNEEKAHRICETMTSIYGIDIAQEAHIYSAALQALQWKDEQFAQEKQQWIEEACEWLENELTYPTMTQAGIDWCKTLIAEFKKAMEKL